MIRVLQQWLEDGGERAALIVSSEKDFEEVVVEEKGGTKKGFKVYGLTYIHWDGRLGEDLFVRKKSKLQLMILWNNQLNVLNSDRNGWCSEKRSQMKTQAYS